MKLASLLTILVMAFPVFAQTSPEGAGKLQPNEVPRLAIRWDCNGCGDNPKVPPLIEKAYAEEAARQGVSVSASETADLAIVQYHQRPPASRAVFGAFAGRDTLSARVVFRQQPFDAGDYSRNAWFGMNSLCETVGRQAFEKISAALRAQPPGVSR